MPRLFIGLPIEGETKWKIQAELEHLSSLSNLSDVRFVSDELWHITLAFLGEQSEDVTGRALSVLQRFQFSQTFKSELYFKGLLLVPDHKAPRYLWLTFREEDNGYLLMLRKELVAALKSEGIRWKEDLREGLLHLTLVRLKEGRSFSLSANVLRDSLCGVPCFFNRLVLYESRLMPQSSYYLERFSRVF